ncbi:MAG: D-2-hydroxyacid dehydrogenase [Erysipelotrichaceae bacterium]|nr:D-2-hydroxyacid dehydrogenase [Erysipelotrichaceae bacterium]
MALKIIVSGEHAENIREKFLSLPDTEVVFVDHNSDVKDEDCLDAEVFVGFIDKDLVARMPKLRYVQLYSAGANTSDWLPENIKLANAYGAYGEAIGEHLLTTTLMAMKRMPDYIHLQDEQKWERLHDVIRFKGSNILSVGMGAIGTTYLSKAHALGAKCYGVRRTVHDKPDFVEKLVAIEDLDELLPEMDVVALSLPGVEAVNGLFDERRLRLMKDTAIILNVGRGNAIVTDDLIKVMNEGHLTAACLDVTDPEPLPEGHPLWTTERVYITPHISGGFKSGMNYESVMNIALNNVKRILNDEEPIHVVDRKLGY